MAEKEKKDLDIRIKEDRLKLCDKHPSRDPYWRSEGMGYVGFRTGVNGGTWLGRIRFNGKYIIETFGRLPDYDTARKLFTEWAPKAMTAAKVGIDTQDVDATVAGACHKYIRDSLASRGDDGLHRRLRNALERMVIGRTEKRYQGKVIAPNPIAAIRLEDLTTNHVDTFRAGLLKNGAKATREQRNTATAGWKIFVAAMNHAYKKKLVSNNDAWKNQSGFGGNPNADQSKRRLSKDESAIIIDGMPEGDYRNALAIIAAVGARPVEVLRMTAADFDPREGVIYLANGKGRTREMKTRKVHIKKRAELMALMKQVCKGKLPHEQLFNVSSPAFTEQMRRNVVKLGIVGASTYSFRHTFISEAIDKGIPIFKIAKYVGTSPAMIESTYGKAKDEDMQNTFQMMD